MSDDLATQSLGISKLSLWERRQQYEQWLASGRHLPRPLGHAYTGPCHTRTDEGPSDPILANRRAAAERDAASTLLNPLPPGAVVRLDESSAKAEMSDDLVLGFGKIMLEKVKDADPATAAIMANAMRGMMAPMIARADAVKKDEDLKNTVIGQGPVKRGSSPGASTAKDDDEEKERHAPDDDDDDDKGKRKDDDDVKDPFTQVLDAIAGLNKRMDSFEKRGKGSDDDDDDGLGETPGGRGAPGGPGEGEPRDLAADDAKSRSASLKRRMRIERICHA
jgi:hypothetical protein